TERYDTTLNQYYYSGYYKYFYDSTGKSTSRIFRNYNRSTSTFELNTKYDDTYDQLGYKTNETYYLWNSSKNAYINKTKTVWSYDNNKNNIQTLSYAWDTINNIWNYYSKTTNTFNSNNIFTTQIDSLWDKTNNNWGTNKTSKYEDQIDVNGNTTSRTLFYWATGNVWAPNTKNEYTYNNLNYKISDLESSYPSGNWSKTFITTYEYDANGNQINYLISSYYGLNGATANYKSLTRTYNLSYKYADIYWPFEISPKNLQNNIPVGLLYKYFYQGKWYNDRKQTYYYSPVSNSNSGIQEKEIPSTSIYPNPSNGLVTINSNQDIANVNVFDITGKAVHNQEYTNKLNQTEIDLSALNNGIYFIAVQSSNGEISKSKIVLAK
ncbi:MAG: T9SS type A sorting domain-containing protein, partial [Bacteroidetes bacterium]|nr:T9SS type A sorting domain-containing protein [Bacteroidota bacterium]